MRVNQQQPLLLSSTIREDNAFLSVDLTNLDSPVNSDDTLPRGTVHIFRLQFLREASCYQHIRLLNYGLQPIRVSLLLQFDADFADIFEVRGTKRERKGERLPDQVEADAAILAYERLHACECPTSEPGKRTRIDREWQIRRLAGAGSRLLFSQ